MNEPSEHTVSEEAKEVVEQYAADELVNDIMMGRSFDETVEDPTKDWDDETRAKVQELMESLHPPEPVKVPEFDLAEHFKVGDRIRDTQQGLIIAVRTVGKDAMTVGVVGKRVSWKVGSMLSMSGQSFVVLRARKNEATLERLGQVLPDYMNDTTEKEAPDGQA